MLVLGLTGAADTLADSLEGIHLIEFADETIEAAIRGRPDRGAVDTAQHYIVTFVSPQGSYASLVSLFGAGGERICVAWAADVKSGAGPTAFGLPPTSATKAVARNPTICEPFELSYDSVGTLRLSVGNAYEHSPKVVAHVPLLEPNWEAPHFARHNVKKISLGPADKATAAVGDGVRVRIGRLQQWFGFQYRKSFEARLPAAAGAGREGTASRASLVRGHVAAGEVIGTPTDVLYALRLREPNLQPVTAGAFEEAVVDEYGPTSLEIGASDSRFGKARFFWLYDLAGARLEEDDASPANCLATAEQWLPNQASLVDFAGDIGPWGCSLVMAMDKEGRPDVVDGYSLEVVSGYVLGLNHFQARVKQTEKLRERIRDLDTYRPTL
jgi:hypothetical protein